MNSKGIEPNRKIFVESPLICQIKNNNTISKGKPFKEIGSAGQKELLSNFRLLIADCRLTFLQPVQILYLAQLIL